MTYSVYVTKTAEEDLDALYQYYLQEFSQTSASHIIDWFRKLTGLLELSPQGYVDFDKRIGRKLFPDGELRLVPDKRLLVFYLIRGQRVDILRIIGAKTNYVNELENLFKHSRLNNLEK